jgi:outer membrane protein TolC
LKFQRNQLFPQLDLNGTFGRNGNSGVYSEVFGQIRDSSGPFYSVGAEFRIPLGNQAARSNYKITKAQRTQALLRLKQLEQTIMVGIEDAVGTANGNYERVKATREASSYADEALKAEQKKLENGKSTNFEVLQLQKNLTTARSAEIQALADYNNALAALAASEGTTLERLNLSLEVK